MKDPSYYGVRPRNVDLVRMKSNTSWGILLPTL